MEAFLLHFDEIALAQERVLLPWCACMLESQRLISIVL